MPLYAYACPQGHVTETLKGAVVVTIPCGCGLVAQRQSVYATQIGGRQRPPVSERPIRMRQYIEAAETLAYEHEKAEESAQRPLPTPPLWRAAKATAKKLERAGVTDSLDYRPEYVR